MNDLTIFHYGAAAFDLRAVQRGDDVWFVAADVCRGLDIERTDSAIRSLDADEKGTHIVSTPYGNQELSIVSEPGLYKLVARSNKPAARAFDRWVRHDVLPAIRKTGFYGVPPALKNIVAELVRDGIKTLLPGMVADAIGVDPRRCAMDGVTALDLCVKAGAIQHKRRGLVNSISHRLTKRCAKSGVPITETERGTRLFLRDIAERFMREEGNALVRDHNDAIQGQTIIRFPSPMKRPGPA